MRRQARRCQGDPVGDPQGGVTVEDGNQCLETFHEHDQPKEPECEPVPVVVIVNLLRKDSVENE